MTQVQGVLATPDVGQWDDMGTKAKLIDDRVVKCDDKDLKEEFVKSIFNNQLQIVLEQM